MGVFWGIGHTATLFVAGLAVIVFKLVIPQNLALGMEFLVGVALLVLGAQILWEERPRKQHVHAHRHGPEAPEHEHPHRHDNGEDEVEHHHPRQHRSLIMGMIHGLAGSAALTLVVLGSTRSAVEGGVYILIFGVGSILGMVIVTTLIGLPFAYSARRLGDLNRNIRLLAGALSVLVGTFIMISIGFAARILSGAS